MADFPISTPTTPGTGWLQYSEVIGASVAGTDWVWSALVPGHARGSAVGASVVGPDWLVPTGWLNLPTPGETKPRLTYKMLGMDAVTQQRDAWLSPGAPDFTGTKYTGPLAKPLRDVAVVDTWSSS